MLKPQEAQTLRFLADGFNYKEIAAKLQIHHSAVYVLCHRIRLATGIESTKSVAQCRAWLEANPDLANARPIPRNNPPTPKQRQAMEFYALQRLTLDKIAWEMKVSKQGAEQHLEMGMARAGIKPRDLTSDRRAEILAFLNPAPVTINDPAFS